MRTARQDTSRTLRDDARTVVSLCPGLKIRQAARRIARLFDSYLAEQNLTFAQFGLMAQVAAADDDSIKGLAALTDLDQSTLSRNLRSLERVGLIEIAVVERDLRRRAVWLTEKGARQLQAAIPIGRRAQAALAHRIDVEAVTALAEATGFLTGIRPDTGRH